MKFFSSYSLRSTFNIDLLYSGSTNPYLHRIGECVLESIAVDYAPNGWAAFEGGAPVQTRMTLQFKETTYLTKDDFKNFRGSGIKQGDKKV